MYSSIWLHLYPRSVHDIAHDLVCMTILGDRRNSLREGTCMSSMSYCLAGKPYCLLHLLQKLSKHCRSDMIYFIYYL